MRRFLATTLLLVFPTAVAAAQAMTFSTTCCKSLHPRILAGIIAAEEDALPAKRHWVRAVILWRADRPIQDGYSIDGRAEVRVLDDAAERAGRFRLGAFQANGVHGADVSRDGAFVWVLNQQFSVPISDSALVILVDHVDTTPTIHGTAYVAGVLPEEYWGKVWESGDTAFLIKPRNVEDNLRRALSTSPRVRQFLNTVR